MLGQIPGGGPNTGGWLGGLFGGLNMFVAKAYLAEVCPKEIIDNADSILAWINREHAKYVAEWNRLNAIARRRALTDAEKVAQEDANNTKNLMEATGKLFRLEYRASVEHFGGNPDVGLHPNFPLWTY
jgi:hypothetical protein